MYYPIYGKYYGSDKVTVTTDSATTTKSWRMARINDRRETPRGREYHVLWIRQRLESREFYQRTWEPTEMLRADNFVEEMDLVDLWKSSGVKKFQDFWGKDECGIYGLGADTTGLCMFHALKRAAELAGRPDIVTQQDIDQFVADELLYHGRDLTKRTCWKVVLRFMRRLRDDARDFIFKAIDKDNFAVAGRRGARVLEEIDLFNCIFLVAAYNHSFVGHGIMLTVQGSKRLIYDLEEGKPISSAEDWINFYAFVRPFIVFRQK